MKKFKNKKVSLEKNIKVIEQDLRDEYSVDGVSMTIMNCLKGKVSPDLLELLMQMLLGFNEDMQLEMADNLLDFAYGHVVHTTGCLSADAVLKSCYSWIAAEKGFILKEKQLTPIY